MFHPRTHRRGVAAVLAMLFLVLFSTLVVAMFQMSATNIQSASSLADVSRAMEAAESGMRWQAYRLRTMSRPKTTIGNITPAVAESLWPSLRTAITANYNSLTNPAERGTTWNGHVLTSKPITSDNGAKFVITLQQHPLYAGDPLDARYIRVTSRGTYGRAVRTVAMDFKIDKKVNFAVVGKVPLQFGRNTIVEGPVAMSTANKYPPLLSLSDFTHFDNQLRSKVSAWQHFLKNNHAGYDGRISLNNAAERTQAENAGYTDYDEDGYIDEFDLFVKHYDADGDKRVHKQEFTNAVTGKLIEPNLWAAINSLGGPLFDGDVVRTGYNDNYLDKHDGYAKIRGQLSFATTAAAWKNNLGSNDIQDMIGGTVVSDTNPPVKFSATTNDLFDISPINFEQCALNYKAKTGSDNGPSSKTAKVFTNVTVSASDANGGTVDERTPYGSTSYQATFRRPVFKNITFRNCRIPKGLNALFDNCKFEGVTFVDMERNIVVNGSTTTSKDDGMTWSQKMLGSKPPSFTKDRILTSTNNQGAQKGNNIRFNNCTFEGPLVSPYATAYTHFSNSWEFTGATLFDNKVDETATIVAPQTNIEMGSFTDPSKAPSTLVGVVVAGNLDIRGTSMVDGSIIITGDGAGNTTLGYFGPSDSDTNSGAMPEGGYGRLNIRYNPTRALPDGIDVAIDVLPEIDTYTEMKE